MMHKQEVRDSFVLVRIGDRRFAVDANSVAEMSPPVRLHKFPHTSRMVSGVIVRRGKIVPVCNATEVVGSRKSFSSVFYLITERNLSRAGELMAIPVNGESELASGTLQEMQPGEEVAPEYIAGHLSLGSDSIPVLNLGVLAESLERAADPVAREAQS